MSEELFQAFCRAMDRAAAAPKGQMVVQGHDEDYQFTVPGMEPFFVEIRGGALAVRKGETQRRGAMEVSGVEVGQDALWDLLEGRLAPVEAMDSGKLYLSTRLYGGAQITILLRIAQDLHKEELLRQALQRR